MSSDNGIYILETANAEFRVKYAQNIDAIYGKFNDETYRWEGDNEKIKEFFHDAPLYDSLIEALDEADRMSNDYAFLEYGICVITDFTDKVFSEL